MPDPFPKCSPTLDYYRPGSSQPPSEAKWYHWLATTLLGLPLITLGSAWICNFALTDYRAYLRPVGLPLGILIFSVGTLAILSPWLIQRQSRRRPK